MIHRNYRHLSIEVMGLMRTGDSFKKARNTIVARKSLKPDEVKELNQILTNMGLNTAKRFLKGYRIAS